MNKNIVTLPQFESLQANTYVCAAIVMVAAIFLSIGIANLIRRQSGTDKSHVVRRIWFIVVGLVASAGFWLYNYLYWLPKIQKVGWQSDFSNENLICLGIVLGGYVVISIVIMLIFRKTKFGSILGKTKK